MFGHQVFRLFFKPDIRAVFFHHRHQVVEDVLREQFVFAFGAVENRDRNAPQPLSGNAPVRAVFHHTVDAVAPPGGDPLHLVDGRQRLFAQVVLLHGDKPLLGRTEDNGLFTAPAVRVGMLHGNVSQKRASFFQLLNDVIVCVKHELTGKMFDIFREFSRVIHRRVVF